MFILRTVNIKWHLDQILLATAINKYTGKANKKKSLCELAQYLLFAWFSLTMQALAYINNKPYYLFKIFLQGQMAKMQE